MLWIFLHLSAGAGDCASTEYRRPREAPRLAISNVAGWIPAGAWYPQAASLTGGPSSSPSCTWGSRDQAVRSGISCPTSLTRLGVSTCLRPCGICSQQAMRALSFPRSLSVAPLHPILLPYFPPGGKSARRRRRRRRKEPRNQEENPSVGISKTASSLHHSEDSFPSFPAAEGGAG